MTRKTKKKAKKKHAYRNAAPAAARSAPRSHTPRTAAARRAPPPEFATTLASIAGGGGGALLGGLLASQEVMSPESVGLAMTIGGGIAAYTTDGNARIAANGLAAAGAGQLALAMMAHHAETKGKKDRKKDDASTDAPPRQGLGPARVWRRYQQEAADVEGDLGFVDDAYDHDDVPA